MGLLTDGTDDRVDLGSLGDFGSTSISGSGFTLSCWVKLGVDSTDSAAALFPVFNHDSVTTNAQSFWWLLNAGYTSGIVNSVGSVLINMGDNTDTGFLYHEVLYGASSGWNDQQWHHHAISIIAPLGTRQVAYYFDGELVIGPTVTDWANRPFNDAMNAGSFVNYTVSPGPALGARTLTSAVSWFDWTQGEWEDARIYKRVLSPNQIKEIFLQKGRDSISDYHRRWDFINSARDLSPNLAPATPANGPTFQQSANLLGLRRRNR